MVIDGRASISLTLESEKHSEWISEGGVWGNIEFVEYDEESDSVLIRNHGKELRLELAKRSSLKANYLQADRALNRATQASPHEREIMSKVDTYRSNEIAKIETLDPRLRNRLKKSVERRAFSYEQHLRLKLADSSSEQNIENTQVPNESKPLIIGSQRKVNQVNSRIWASDHIEEFGTPDP